MKKSFFIMLLLVVVMLAAAGCSPQYFTKKAEHYIAPPLDTNPETFTIIASALNPILDLAEGVDGGFAWKAIKKDGEGNEHQYTALNLDYSERCGQYATLTAIPKRLSEIEGHYFFIASHDGKKIYNHLGQPRDLESPSKKVDVKKHKGFLTEIKSGVPYIFEVKKGSKEYDLLIQLYESYGLKQLEKVGKYAAKKYAGKWSNFSAEDLNKLAEKDEILRRTKDWLGEDWFFWVGIPLMGLPQTGVQMAVYKMMSIPDLFSDKVNEPGYMEYLTDSETSAKIALRAIKRYGCLTK